MSLPRRLAVGTAAGAALLLTAAPALAHPSFNPNTITAGERHTVDFVIPHGCTPDGGAPDEGEQTSPTTAVAVQIPDALVGSGTFVGPREADGWTLNTKATTITWTDNGGATTDPITFQIDLEVNPDASATTYWFTVAQDCEEGSVLWIASPDKEGDNPAAVLNIGDAVGNAEVDHGDDHGDAEHGDDEHGDDAEHADDMEHGDDAEHVAAEDEGGSALDPGLAIVMLLVVVGGIAGILKMD